MIPPKKNSLDCIKLPFSYCKLSRAADVLQCDQMDMINLAIENKIEINVLLDHFYCSVLFKGNFEQAEEWYESLSAPTLSTLLSAQSRMITNHSVIEFDDGKLFELDGAKTGADIFCEDPQGEYIRGFCFAHGLWRVNDLRAFQRCTTVENFFPTLSPCLAGAKSPIVQILPGDLGEKMRELGRKAFLACTQTISTEDLWVTKYDIERIISADFDFDKLSFVDKVENPSTNTKSESGKTIAKKGEMIEALLKLIPEFSSEDVEEMAPAKIKNLVEAVASERGVAFPETDLGTWSKYLRRGRHQK